ncbi:hypothetical protein EXE46_03935 [Halorubrum sp. GN11_10-6_MGM]|uniref:hypothetical protein n=1 Tax=Halorubrum sp. GN11_10-6_MGM TaxID=2518112 RepID=UPI0010FA1721|nr:hypothetical protein [Halorubrum sp. GN11_10-6_MGM]TKX75311.1 hypothetical protein EXE46_03935 [Halorubrum sp. GN11_10-6_MGM]
MRKTGLTVSALGLATSALGTLLLFAHATDRYHAAIQDMGTIAVAYLGLIVFGATISITGVALLVSARDE